MGDYEGIFLDFTKDELTIEVIHSGGYNEILSWEVPTGKARRKAEKLVKGERVIVEVEFEYCTVVSLKRTAKRDLFTRVEQLERRVQELEDKREESL